MHNQWFIIQTLSGQENKVKDSIEKRVKTDEMQDYVKEVLVPIEKVVEVRNQKKTVSNRKLWPGEYANVTLKLSMQSNALVIPNQAMQTGQDGTYVYVVDADRKADVRPITIGLRGEADLPNRLEHAYFGQDVSAPLAS